MDESSKINETQKWLHEFFVCINFHLHLQRLNELKLHKDAGGEPVEAKPQ